MKEKYSELEIETIEFQSVDIITDSSITDDVPVFPPHGG